ncbi:hypothetical protein E2C01_074736 [Portunus trituberculatus]|uniref:Uncharacterized protein n=1 Tax=Portunus trituberculatus TaxID=210409 RepID=A0A5B7IH14_PORTR|nr:hypothetical protein [Portunus trituberculatus]
MILADMNGRVVRMLPGTLGGGGKGGRGRKKHLICSIQPVFAARRETTIETFRGRPGLCMSTSVF